MEKMPGRNELEGTSIQEYPLFGEGWEAKPLSLGAIIGDYLEFILNELQYGINHQEGNNPGSTNAKIIDAAASLDIFLAAYRSCSDRGWTDHLHGGIRLDKRQGASSAAHLHRTLGITEKQGEHALARLKDRGEIRAAGKRQPTPRKYYTLYHHAALDDPPIWGKRLFSAKAGTHAYAEKAGEYKAFWNIQDESKDEKREPVDEKREPIDEQESVEKREIFETPESEKGEVIYKSNGIEEVSIVYDTNTPTEPTPAAPVEAVDEAPTASVQPPEINSMAWLKLYTAFGLMVRDCEDPAQKEQLTEFYHVMRNGATDERRAACSKLMAYRDRITAAAPARA